MTRQPTRRTRIAKLWYQKRRRDRFRDAELCVNGCGPATNGVRCKHCYDVHKESA